MRRIRYAVATSLDGYIASPNGEYDWILADPEIDFAGMMAQFDTMLMGRRTYEAMGAVEGPGSQGMDVWVVSRTLKPEDHPAVTVVAENVDERLRQLRAQPGKDIWLFGGGDLFRSLLEMDKVDTVEVAVMPVFLGGGVSLLPAPAVRRSLSLTAHRVYAHTGTVSLEYAVQPTINRTEIVGGSVS
jgi:dihydrofolate reductase